MLAFNSTDLPQMALKLASPEAVKKPSLQLCHTGQDIDFKQFSVQMLSGDMLSNPTAGWLTK